MQFTINNVASYETKMDKYVPAIENVGITIKKKKDSKGFDPTKDIFTVNLESLDQLVDLTKAVKHDVIVSKNNLTIFDDYIS
jgi:uncharacterized protein YaaR (DUF327 family)